MALPLAISAHGAAPCFLGGPAFRRRSEFHSGTSRFRKTDRDRLPGIRRAMFSLTDMVHFFADEFTGLRRGGFALSFVTAGPFECLLLRHIAFV